MQKLSFRGRFDPSGAKHEFIMASIPKIRDKKTALSTLDTAMVFGRPTQITFSCMCQSLNCICSQRLIAVYRKEITKLLGGEVLFSVLCMQEAFPGEIFLKVIHHEGMIGEHHGQ